MATQNAPVVLITGINGFIGSMIGLRVLEKGYRVRAAVRNRSKLDTLLQGAYKEYAQQVEVAEVADIRRDDAYDQAVVGVHHIIHTASPVDFSLQTPQAFIEPAITGTTNILKSAAKYSPNTVKSAVITSSIAAAVNPSFPSNYVFTESDWNNESEAEIEEKGAEAPPFAWYCASKTAAEKAQWKWVDDKKPPFAVTAINPAFVYGPVLALPESPASLNATTQPIWSILSGQMTEVPEPVGSASFVDVRDVARLHVWAMEHPEAANHERYIAVSGQSVPQAMVDILRKGYPQRDKKIVVGNPGKGYKNDYTFTEGGFSSDKAVQATGESWIGLEQCVLDAAKSLEGFLKD